LFEGTGAESLRDTSETLEYIPAEKESHKAMGNSPK
jgi:hypothetical protein